MNMLASWKTTAAGIAVILAALATIVGDIGAGGLPTAEHIGILFTGIIGIFAKDAGVTGAK